MGRGRPIPEDPVYYNDEWMERGWPEKIQEAQRTPTYEILGAVHRRVPYGEERRYEGLPLPPMRVIAEQQVCGDCSVRKGQLHVPGCDIEECPACGGQAICCPCTREEQRRLGRA